MKTKTITAALDEQGRPIVRVPLGRAGNKGYATLYLQDFESLIELGLSASWNRLPKGYVTASCANAPGNAVQVARVLLDAGPYELVRYVNGDLTDLRAKNVLKLYQGAAKRRDRDYVKPLKRPHKIEYDVEHSHAA